MGCISCKKLPARPLPGPPSPHALPLQYLQQQKGGPQESSVGNLKGSPESGVGSETQQGPVESTFSPAGTLGEFSSPPLSTTDVERDTSAKQHQRDGGIPGKKLLPAAPFPLVGWPEEKEIQEEGEIISTEAQQESLQRWLQAGHTPQLHQQQQQQQQQQQHQPLQKRNDMIIPMRSNDFYGYRQGSRSSPPLDGLQQQQQQQQQKQQQQQQRLRDKKNLSAETLACVRRGFDACVLRDTTKAQVELRQDPAAALPAAAAAGFAAVAAIAAAFSLVHRSLVVVRYPYSCCCCCCFCCWCCCYCCWPGLHLLLCVCCSKAEGLYAVLREGEAAFAAAGAARRHVSVPASSRWPAAAASSSSSSIPIEIDIEKRIVNLRHTLKDLQAGFLAADARRALFAHAPTSPVLPAAAAAAAAAARRQKVVIPVPRTNLNRRLT